MTPLLLNINMIKRESRIGHPLESNWVLQIGYQWSQPLYYLQLLQPKVIIFYIHIHNVLEQPRSYFTSLKLCKYCQISHPSTRVSSTCCRWHIFRFDTGYKGGNPFLLILKPPGLTCVICCN